MDYYILKHYMYFKHVLADIIKLKPKDFELNFLELKSHIENIQEHIKDTIKEPFIFDEQNYNYSEQDYFDEYSDNEQNEFGDNHRYNYYDNYDDYGESDDYSEQDWNDHLEYMENH